MPATVEEIEADRRFEKLRRKQAKKAEAKQAALAAAATRNRCGLHTSSSGARKHLELMEAKERHERYRDSAIDAYGHHEAPSMRLAHSVKYPFGSFGASAKNSAHSPYALRFDGSTGNAHDPAGMKGGRSRRKRRKCTSNNRSSSSIKSMASHQRYHLGLAIVQA